MGAARAAITLLLLGLAVAGCADGRYSAASSHRPAGYAGSPPTVYTVRPGDTLYSIAWRYGLDFHAVARWNDIPAPYTIYPKQPLRLRPPVSSPSSAPAVAAPTPEEEPASGTQEPTSAPTTKHQSGNSEADRTQSARRWRWPVEGQIVQDYAEGAPGNRGVAIAGRTGMAVHAAAPGRIVYSGNGLRGYGNLLIIRHDSRYLTAYGFNQELLVAEGDTVAGGETIAKMGKQPDIGPALHFEIRRDGHPVNPLPLLPTR